ncbi:MAG: hypothetical protein KBI41_11155 [Kiritimatiellae bacterium]|nr:hypothetical protein [Kiritimatiellia bacterium]
MKRIVGMLSAGVCALGLLADGGFSVTAGKSTLLVDTNGLSLTPSVAACPASQATGEPFWALLLEPHAVPTVHGQGVVITDAQQGAPRWEKLPDGVRLVYDTLTDGGRVFKIGLTLEIRGSGDAFTMTGSVTNAAHGWLLTGFTGPVLNGIATDLSRTPALLPEGFGKRINRVPAPDEKQREWQRLGNNYEASVVYPGVRGTMQWFALAGREGGLYVGSHDPLHRAKQLSLRYDPSLKRFGMAVRHDFFCRSGESVALAPVVVQPYAGSWHAAARLYRTWFDSVKKLRDVPAWARDTSGWLLCILKQQNGEIMWPYTSLDKLCDVADARGLDILGLFGWAHGGHDHLYPDYIPCPEMGGVEALKKGLKEAKRRGKRTIIYANGQLQEREATEFWRTVGKDIAITRRDGTTYQHTYHKYRNIPVYRFDLGCLYAQAWYDRMLSLAIQANELGADGILYDQLGMMAPMACYGEGHGHPVPSMAHEVERPVFLKRIADHMRQINPDFIVMTEGLHDCALDAISMFHGCTLGTYRTSASEMLVRLRASRVADPFPELFRTVFPEVMSTIRVPTPMMDRDMVNYTCVYGMRYEIESRYGPDATYLREDRVPESDDYVHVVNKPDVAMMRATPPVEAARYLKEAIDFQRENAAFFWHGRFVDSQGFTLTGKDLVAKGFAAGDRFGVVIWNPLQTVTPFTLEVPGYALESASEPGRERVDPLAPMAASTVRLLRWKITSTSPKP